mmetsp:Transcript_855/g.1781  ORF Transcript_855/g.1781 Transcript_855/m.1781 type:complete len:223 (-) Transcript_855:958-1626(-)
MRLVGMQAHSICVLRVSGPPCKSKVVVAGGREPQLAKAPQGWIEKGEEVVGSFVAFAVRLRAIATLNIVKLFCNIFVCPFCCCGHHLGNINHLEGELRIPKLNGCCHVGWNVEIEMNEIFLQNIGGIVKVILGPSIHELLVCSHKRIFSKLWRLHQLCGIFVGVMHVVDVVGSSGHTLVFDSVPFVFPDHWLAFWSMNLEIFSILPSSFIYAPSFHLALAPE